jgi:hypothetical protein
VEHAHLLPDRFGARHLLCVSAHGGNPSPRQQELIGQVTHIASITIERAQADAALKRSETYLAEAQEEGSALWDGFGEDASTPDAGKSINTEATEKKGAALTWARRPAPGVALK